MCETLLKTPKFNVVSRSAELADGRRVTRQVVEHPGAVVILPVLEDGGLVMIRNRRIAVGETLLELPAGTLEPPETPEACAARELREETGYAADRIEPLCQFFTSPGFLTERMYAFVATGLSQVGQDLEETEQIEVEIFRPDRIRQMLTDGGVTDGKTIAVLGVYYLKYASAV